ncbi:hypothetical protein PR048_000749 [Dryococelus australis]|uniref:Protein kinase domain-containing protein n=1 Tax=Dryococelus australis TaxID=614101 RepID=A0ABQ9IG34_9NEOP|nr:hypothetical protein PR048_000749 [Dryococelus australis]
MANDLGNNSTTGDVSIDKFVLIKSLGEGVFGKVYLARKQGGKDNGCYYALKQINKSGKYKTKQQMQEFLLREKRILEAVRNAPFLPTLHYAFQSTEAAFLVLDLALGGDLFDVLEDCQYLTQDQTCLVMAQVMVALRTLHDLGVIHRDIKLENILVDQSGNIMISDFGLSSISHPGKFHHTFCGTPGYMAPEVLRRSSAGYTAAIDFWAVGILGFELLTGYRPFDLSSEGNEKKTIQNILSQEPEIPEYLYLDTKYILKSLLSKDPHHRIGGIEADFNEVQVHPFFKSIDWVNIPPPLADWDRLESNTICDQKECVSEIRQVFPGSLPELLPGFDNVASMHKGPVMSTNSLASIAGKNIR